MALRARKVSGAFEKRAPGPLKQNYSNLYTIDSIDAKTVHPDYNSEHFQQNSVSFSFEMCLRWI